MFWLQLYQMGFSDSHSANTECIFVTYLTLMMVDETQFLPIKESRK